jgi:hypothetical protein
METKFFSEEEGGKLFGEPSLYGRIILKFILKH